MATVTRQIASRAYYAKLDEPDFDLRAWKLRADDYDVVLELTKGVKQPDGKWEWNDKFELTLSESDIDALLVLMESFANKVKRGAYQAGVANTEASKIFANPFITLRGNKYIVSLWCILTHTVTPDGKTSNIRDTEIRIYDYAGDRELLDRLRRDVKDNSKNPREYPSGMTPVYTFKLSSLSRVSGLFVYEDIETLNVLYDAIKLCRLKESAVFVDHFKAVQEKLGDKASSDGSDNVGYNNKIPANSEPATPSITENDVEFPF